MNTTEVSFENVMDDTWSVKMPLILMIGGPIYLGALVILIMCAIKQCREWCNMAHSEETESQSPQVENNTWTAETYVIHYWVSEDDNYAHLEDNTYLIVNW